jgi:hypothetical protein
MTAAIFSFLGIVAGAALQYFFSRHLDSLRAHRDARTKAYTDYLHCVSEHANPNQMKSTDGHELGARTADAKCRICLYGSGQAIAAFAKFERLGATMHNREQQEAFTQMVAIMRCDSTKSTKVATNDLQVVLLGVDRPVEPVASQRTTVTSQREKP